MNTNVSENLGNKFSVLLYGVQINVSDHRISRFIEIVVVDICGSVHVADNK